MKNSGIKITFYVKNIARGFLMGMAEAIPGVSGSTLAMIMGIYTEFIDILHSFSDIAKEILFVLSGKSKASIVMTKIKEIKWPFTITLFLGMAIAIISMSHLLTELFDAYPQYIKGYFFGLVLASVLIPYSKIESKNRNILLLILVSSIVTFLFLGIHVSRNDHPSLLLLIISGILGVSGLILPGVSGSFILLMLGTYEYIISSVKSITQLTASSTTILNLIIFTLSLIVGFVTFVRVVKKLFSNYPDITLAVISGIMLGSVRVIYPYFEIFVNGDLHEEVARLPFFSSEQYSLVLITVYILAGALSVILLHKIGTSREDDAGIV